MSIKYKNQLGNKQAREIEQESGTPMLQFLLLSQKHFQLFLLCWCKNDGNAVAHSILLVSKIVRKQGPLKIKN